MDRAGFEIERRRGVDLVGQRIEPRGAQLRVRQLHVLQRLHQVAEHGALRAAGGLHLLLQLLLVVGLALGAHHDDRELLVVVDAGDDVVRLEHVLVEQIADREIVGIVADRHRGDDLLRIEEDRQRALDRDAGLDRLSGLVDAGDALGQPRIMRVRLDEIALGRHAPRAVIVDLAALGLSRGFGRLLGHGRSAFLVSRRTYTRKAKARHGPGSTGETVAARKSLA